MAHCLIALGSNLGDRAARLRQATDELNRLPATQLIARSSWRETTPIGGPAGQGSFLNAAALIDSTLAPAELAAELQRIELQLGRQRTERWAARSLDLDLLLYDTKVMRTPELTIPHPRMAFRRFVLEPAAVVAAWMIHPESGWTVGGLLHHLNAAPESIAVAAAEDSAADELVAQMAGRLNLPVAINPSPQGDRPAIGRWSVGDDASSAVRPKLLLAVADSAGTDSRKMRRILHLPSTGPVAWIAANAAQSIDEGVAAVQSVWPTLAT